MRPSTIKDVAKKVGVSARTVSGIINKNVRVSEKTRQEVLKAIEELNYSPNIAARMLVRSGSKQPVTKGTIGFLISQSVEKGFNNSYFSGILNGAVQESKKLNLKLYTDFVPISYRETIDLPAMIQDGSLAGLMIASKVNEGFTSQILRMKIPLVTLFKSSLSGTRISSVSVDNYKGAYMATEYLIREGHKKIGLIKGDPENVLTEERLRGYMSAFESNGIQYDENLVETGDFMYDGGYSAMEKLLNKTERPTAVFAMNDLSAVGAKTAIEDHGLKVPEDISLVGFDDIDLATQVRPNLTTIRVFKEEIGRQAVRRLNEIVNNTDEKQVPVSNVLEPQLVERESVKKIG